MERTRLSRIQEGSRPGPQRLTRILTKLGPTFIKIGQFLALRPDILPQEYCDELLQLVDQVPTTPWTEVREILTEELGTPPERLFAYIRRRPLASGSIAQVHLARTRKGRSVAVKVQRPDLPTRIARDLRRIRWLARLIRVSGIGPLASPQELVDELERWLRQELDFTKELSNQTRMYEGMSCDATVRVPQPFPELSSRRVLVSEYLPGVAFSELIRLVRRGDFSRISKMGLDRNRLAEGLIETSFHQIFQMRFFHADLHPGNLIAMSGNVIGLVDFGLTDVLDPSVEKWHAEYLRALYNNDIPGMYRAISQIFIEGPTTDREAFRRDFYAATNLWVTRMEDATANGANRSSNASYMITVMQLARAHDMRPPASVLSMYRTLLASESVAYHLQSTADLRTVGRDFFNELQIERIFSYLEPQRIAAWLMELNELVRSGPGYLQQLLSDIADGRFMLSVRSEESEQERRLANQRTRLLALAIVSMGLALLITHTNGQPGGLGHGVEQLLWGGLLAVYAWMAIIWRRLK
jgi:ubiquinone biosynthesis protein